MAESELDEERRLDEERALELEEEPPIVASYVVHEAFYSIQGEGANAGRPAVFLRFAGCNLWSGRDEDRAAARCTFCDTEFRGGRRYFDAAGLADAASRLWPGGARLNPGIPRGLRPLVILTGGEPMLQVDQALISALHSSNFTVAVETNGTIAVPPSVDWIAVSPKAGTEVVQRSGQELKLVFPQDGVDPETFLGWDFAHFCLQPMDGPTREHNVVSAIRYCLDHPQWRLSLQMHKSLGLR